MAKLTERIPLEPYAYIEIEADTLEELALLSKTTRQAFQDRISKEKTVQVYSDQEDPPNLAQRAAQSFGAAAKPYDAFSDGMGLKETCDTCQAEMELKTKTSKKTGKPYQAWFCPNWKYGVTGHEMKFPKR